MSRSPRVTSESGVYHLMIRGNERKNLFLDEYDRDHFLNILAKKKAESATVIYAYCLMDNHVHLVLRDMENELSGLMRGLNTSYAMFFNSKYGRTGHLFQGRFKSEVVENDRYLMACIRYVHNNPVKAGIVAQARQYPWSSYGSYVDRQSIQSGLVEVDFILEMMSQSRSRAIVEFERFSNETDEAEFMDEDQNTARTIDEGRVLLKSYLEEFWPGQNLEAIMKDVSFRNDTVRYLKENSQLSVRKIAALLGINRGLVHLAIREHNSK